MDKWEYKVEVGLTGGVPSLGRLGQEGWELVAVAVWNNTFKYFFKRRLEE